MNDTTPQAAEGKLLWHFSMSLDGFIAGPGHSMDWMPMATNRPGLIDEYTATTGAVLGGRDGWDAFPDAGAVYGGAWSGPVYVLTHHPEGAGEHDGVTFLNCDVAQAAEIARGGAAGKNVEVLSASIGRQLLDRGLLDEIDVHILPVLLGDGIRMYDAVGGAPVPLRLVNGDPLEEINLRYQPLAASG